MDSRMKARVDYFKGYMHALMDAEQAVANYNEGSVVERLRELASAAVITIIDETEKEVKVPDATT